MPNAIWLLRHPATEQSAVLCGPLRVRNSQPARSLRRLEVPMNKHALAALGAVFAVTLASGWVSIQALVTSYSHTNFDPALRTLVGVGRLQAIEFNGPTGTGKVYLIG